MVRRALYRDWNAGIRRSREDYEQHPFADIRRNDLSGPSRKQ